MGSIVFVMVCKDEAAVLRRTLESWQPVVDAWCVCDTGSTDETCAIIEEVTGQPPLHLDWTNYADTKNRALELARGRGDFVVLADADEVLVGGADALRERAAGDTDGVSGWISEGPGPNGPVTCRYARLRMWRNDGRWAFAHGPGVHEVCVGGSWVMDGRIVVYHDHRHRTGESYGARFAGYAATLEAWLTEHPEDLRARFYLGRTYMDLGRHLAAIEHYTRYLAEGRDAGKGGYRDEEWQAAYDVAQCWKVLGEYGKALEWCRRAAEIDARRAESATLAGRLYYELQDWPRAVQFLQQAVGLPVPDDVILFLDPRQYREVPADMLQIALDRLRDYEGAMRASQILIDSATVPAPRHRDNAWWARRRVKRKWFLLLGHTPEAVTPQSLETGCGGVETTYICLARALAELDQDVTVFAECPEEATQGRVRWLPYGKLGEYAGMRPDVVVTSRWFAPLADFSAAHKIIWLQDAYFADPGGAFGQASAVVVSSPWHRSYVAERYGHGVPAERLHIIPLGVDLRLFRQHIARDPDQVIYSSNPDRGLAELAQMWPKIRERFPRLHLVVTYGWQGLKTWSAGQEWQDRVERDRAAVIDALMAAGNVTLTGRLGKSALAREILRSTLCLYPNNFFETFCLTALECQAAGVPLITSNLGALPTTIAQGAGVLIDGAAASATYQQHFIAAGSALLADSVALSSAAAAGRAWASGFDWDVIARRWLRLEWDL